MQEVGEAELLTNNKLNKGTFISECIWHSPVGISRQKPQTTCFPGTWELPCRDSTVTSKHSQPCQCCCLPSHEHQGSWGCFWHISASHFPRWLMLWLCPDDASTGWVPEKWRGIPTKHGQTQPAQAQRQTELLQRPGGAHSQPSAHPQTHSQDSDPPKHCSSHLNAKHFSYRLLPSNPSWSSVSL